MKQKHWILSISGILAVCGIVALFLLNPAARVSMTLLRYQRWPHGAVVRLTNGTERAIYYLAEADGTARGCPMLHEDKTPDGWTESSSNVSQFAVLAGRP